MEIKFRHLFTIFAMAFSVESLANAYFGASYLYSDYKVEHGSGSYTDSNSGYNLYGGYHVTPFISLEAGYADFVDTHKNSENIYSNAWLASGKFSVPILKIFDVYGRLGLGHFHNSVKVDNGFYYGIGSGVTLGRIRVSMEYTQYETKIISNSYALSAEFNF